MTDEFKSEIVYMLKGTFKYHHQGEEREAKNLIVRAPSNKVAFQVSQIEEELNGARKNILDKFADKVSQIEEELNGARKNILDKFADTNEKKEIAIQTSKKIDSGDKPENILVFMKMFGADMQKIINAFRDILTSGNTENPVCAIDGVEKMTVPIYENMTYKDTQCLLEMYIANFIDTSQEH